MMETSHTVYPYDFLSLPDPIDMFNKLCAYKPPINNDRYELYLYNIEPLYQGYYYSTQSDKNIEDKIDNISSHYTENIRLNAIRKHKKMSPMDFWYNYESWIRNESEDEEVPLKNIIWKEIGYATIFKPTWMKFLFEVLYSNIDKTSLKMLDFSSGWGDRLIAAISMGVEYVGYDPNIDLMFGHSKIIKELGYNQFDRYRIYYNPFETAQLIDDEFDIVFTSPPYFDVESYSTDKTQSSVRYNNYHLWKNRFMFTSIDKSWNVLKKGGYLALHISNINKQHISDDITKHMRNKLNSEYMGVIGVAGYDPKYRPIWIWKKL